MSDSGLHLPTPLSEEETIWQALRAIPDPEIPVLTIVDLGIIRDVREQEGHYEVVITPTYTGCPASHAIELSIRTALDDAGFKDARISTQIAPPWTTAWISEEGRIKLKAYGIAPPKAETDTSPIACPHCGSQKTECISEHGSTACKALYRCLDCLEPFDYFKCI